MHDQNWRRRVEEKLDRLIHIGEKLLMTGQEEIALLQALDAATTTIGGNVQKVADDVQTISKAAAGISTEIDQLIANQGSNVPADVANALTALKGKVDTLTTAAQSSSDALDAQVPVLQALATKGSAQPVPVPPPAPPTNPAAVQAAQETTPMVD